MADAFFDVTKMSLDSVTDLCNLIHPISVSMWNMRVEIGQMQEWIPDLTNEQLGRRFLRGSGLSGVDCISAFIDTSWETHKEKIAWIFLNNLFAIYEGWLHGLKAEIFDAVHGNLSEKAMQFPDPKKKTQTDASGNKHEIITGNGIIEELAKLTNDESQLLCNSFYESYVGKKHRCFVKDAATNASVIDEKQLKNLLYCYRFFKEQRNCYIHNGLIANQALIDAYNLFCSKVSAPADLGMDEIPEHAAPVLGQHISVSLRGVIGFSHVILMIMLTIDTKLLRSKHAEREVARRLSNRYGEGPKLVLNRNPENAIRDVVKIFKEAGFCNPKFGAAGTLQLFSKFLVDHSVVRPMDYYKNF